MPNIHFSVLDNIKMTCEHLRSKVSFKITNRKDMFTLPLVDLEYVYT